MVIATPMIVLVYHGPLAIDPFTTVPCMAGYSLPKVVALWGIRPLRFPRGRGWEARSE